MNFFRRFFKVTEPGPGHEVSAGQISPAGPDWLFRGLNVGQLTHIGQVRTQNQDAIFTVNAFLEYYGGYEPSGLFIVADGMGGHQQGEQASLAAVRAAAGHILQQIFLPYLTHKEPSADSPPLNDVLIAAVQKANIAVQQAAPEGGTTLTAALVMGNNAYIAHVGDSRAYIFEQGTLKQITTDHSLARRMKEMGQTALGERPEIQNVLYRALGQSHPVEVDIHLQHLSVASSLVLCSDGLWGAVSHDDFVDILQQEASPQMACRQLVARANESGGDDNISVIIITMGREPLTSGYSDET